MNDTVRLGVLTDRRTGTGETIVTAARELGHYATITTTPEIGIEIVGDEIRVDPTVDVWLNWMQLSRTVGSSEGVGLIHALEDSDATVVNGMSGHYVANHKGATATQLAACGIPTPDTMYSFGGKTVSTSTTSTGRTIQKETMGGAGTNVEEKTAGDSASLYKNGDTGVVQEYVETDTETHADARVFVVGGVVVAAMRRVAPDDDFRTNISKRGTGERAPPDTERDELAKQAADAVGVEVAGVDLIQDTNGNWGVLELNCPAGFSGLTDATGINVAPYIAAHCLLQSDTIDGEQSVNNNSFRDGIVDLWEAAGVLSTSMEYPQLLDNNRCEYVDLTTIAEATVAGRSGSQTVSIDYDWGLDSSLVTRDVAADIGAHLSSERDDDLYVNLYLLAGGRRWAITARIVDEIDGDVQFCADQGVFTQDNPGSTRTEHA